MSVEGYGDYEKEVPLPPGSQTIPAHKAASSSALVPQGFPYSEVSAGDLTNVRISLSLYDANDTLMASYQKEFNLKE